MRIVKNVAVTTTEGKYYRGTCYQKDGKFVFDQGGITIEDGQPVEFTEVVEIPYNKIKYTTWVTRVSEQYPCNKPFLKGVI